MIIDGQNIRTRDLIESMGADAFTLQSVQLLDEKKVKPEDFSIHELWEGFVGPVEDTLSYGLRASGFLTEAAVDSTAFANMTGQLISSKMIEAYNNPAYIGEQLVTNMPSRLKTEKITGIKAVQLPESIEEGMPYEDVGFSEKYATSEAGKKGMILSLTEETIFFDQTGQILMRAGQIGDRARLEKEKVIMNGVQDTANTVFKPQGAAEALYRTAAGTNSDRINEIAASNALVDWTDIDETLAIFANMTDEQGERVMVTPNILLTPLALRSTANRIANATEISYENITSGVGTVTKAVNPVQGIRPLSSVFLDAVSSVDWYLGDFPRQFIWQDVWPLQVFRAIPGNAAEFRRDVKAMFKVRYFGGMSAIDDCYVIFNDVS